MGETVNQNRRRMLAATVVTIAATQVHYSIAADAPARGTNSSFSSLKQVNAGLLNAVQVGGAVAQSIPTLSEGALVLLALFIGAAAMAYRRNRMR